MSCFPLDNLIPCLRLAGTNMATIYGGTILVSGGPPEGGSGSVVALSIGRPRVQKWRRQGVAAFNSKPVGVWEPWAIARFAYATGSEREKFIVTVQSQGWQKWNIEAFESFGTTNSEKESIFWSVRNTFPQRHLVASNKIWPSNRKVLPTLQQGIWLLVICQYQFYTASNRRVIAKDDVRREITGQFLTRPPQVSLNPKKIKSNTLKEARLYNKKHIFKEF